MTELPTTAGEARSVCISTGLFCDPDHSVPALNCCNVVPEPCKSDLGCSQNPTAPVCGDDGECICDDDAQCIAPGLPICVAGVCSCTSDADCAVLATADVCIDGTCGCSSATVCSTETYHDGARPVCEPL